MAERQALLALAANIVSAHVSNNAVALDQLPELIRQVLNTLTTVEQATAAPTKPEPAVPVRRSVFPDHIVCLDCGKQFSMLRRHLMTDHKMTPEQYSSAGSCHLHIHLLLLITQRRGSTLAKKFGLGRKRAAVPKKAGRMVACKAIARR